MRAITKRVIEGVHQDMNNRIKELKGLIANSDCKDCDVCKGHQKELDKLTKHEGHETINLDNGQTKCITCQIKQEELENQIDDQIEASHKGREEMFVGR